MEKLFKIKATFLKFLSKQPTVSLAGYQNPTLSPCRSPTTHVVSLFPKEARRKHRRGISFSPKEPTSPKVSCMGEIKSKKKKKKKDKKLHKGVQEVVPNKNVLLWISKGSYEGGRQGGKEKESAIVSVPPTLDTMKKFTSGRGSLSDFDATLSDR